MILKSSTAMVSKNILIKIRSLGSNNFLLWLFGPLGAIKIFLQSTSLVVLSDHVLILLIELINDSLSKRIAYSEGLAHLIRSGSFNLSKGYVLYMKTKGVGYKLEYFNSRTLSITLGYSHKINLTIPFYIKVCILKKRIMLWSHTLTKLQQFCHVLSYLRKKDPYNAKGIFQPHLQRKLKIGKISRI
jgi:ribosomal protein L6P/L9E